MRLHGADSEETLQWERASVWYHHIGIKSRLDDPGSKLWMCAEDVNNQIFHQFNSVQHDRSGSLKKSVWVDGCSQDLQRILAGSLRTDRYHEDLQDAVKWFVAAVAQEMVSYGKSTYELCLGWDQGVHTRQLKAARLLWIPSESILRIGGKVLQIVPTNAPEDYSPGKSVALDPARLVMFSPPEKWVRHLNRVRYGLVKLGESEHNWMGGMVNLAHVKEDFATVKRTYSVELGRLTAPIGWNARGSMNDDMGNVHAEVRDFRWKRFCVDLRDNVLMDLKKVFRLIGKHLGESPILRWDHLLSHTQIQADEDELM
ncbi:hypothetical protein [Geothrix edaphica]|uniref:Uncharacterized protein n=1 Tax=Geothrix edaphica TaxID=2927976 RepID=A0ABQ5Q0R5_9BACT|nr:hypothetical protein [Geothrix edaphica]GLH68228.1 hypothetical protein GETHED_25920 [Geothrix edaphica]